MINIPINKFEFPLTAMGRDVVVPVLEEGAPIFGGLYDNVKELDNGTLSFLKIYILNKYTVLTQCDFHLAYKKIDLYSLSNYKRVDTKTRSLQNNANNILYYVNSK